MSAVTKTRPHAEPQEIATVCAILWRIVVLAVLLGLLSRNYPLAGLALFGCVLGIVQVDQKKSATPGYHAIFAASMLLSLPILAQALVAILAR
jgi:hypothetical protein